MKLLKTCPLLIGIVAISLILTATSFALEDSTYASYKEDYDPAKLPHFILVMKGLTDGIYPWDEKSGGGTETGFDDYLVEDEKLETEDGDTTGNEPENEDASGSFDSGEAVNNQEELLIVSGNSAEDSVSDNDADRTYEFEPVDEDYFMDALFIGDSRTVGLSEYCEPLDTRATFYAKVSLTIYKVLQKQIVKTDTDMITIEQALSENQFGKIYIMLGLNEIGTGTAESFAEEYGNVVNRIRELQPDAIIYIQGIMHVTEHKSSNDKYFNNDNINRRNEELSKLADNKTVFYMDMNEAVDDENGNLLKELSGDDVHLKAFAYERWYQFLLDHGIVKD
ncbi:GDSL-type esterase/lipase family protein [Butyrivibrio sp. VCB2006]|uniref:GDSL-type esterase/lipase family protein n=1 Tax=Butyrivibrio sp. VCB2006 TaxID=1280679 RepID=UPI000403A2BC|nr:GDSL-type esterase/lipase family protein [Butyrivibrio sp. VCB2006]